MTEQAHDHDCDDGDDEQRTSYPFSAWGHLYNIAQFLAAVAADISMFFNITSRDLAAHNNHFVDRRIERRDRRLLLDDLESFERGERP